MEENKTLRGKYIKEHRGKHYARRTKNVTYVCVVARRFGTDGKVEGYKVDTQDTYIHQRNNLRKQNEYFVFFIHLARDRFVINGGLLAYGNPQMGRNKKKP